MTPARAVAARRTQLGSYGTALGLSRFAGAVILVDRDFGCHEDLEVGKAIAEAPPSPEVGIRPVRHLGLDAEPRVHADFHAWMPRFDDEAHSVRGSAIDQVITELELRGDAWRHADRSAAWPWHAERMTSEPERIALDLSGMDDRDQAIARAAHGCPEGYTAVAKKHMFG